jgi:hypothetical protein
MDRSLFIFISLFFYLVISLNSQSTLNQRIQTNEEMEKEINERLKQYIRGDEIKHREPMYPVALPKFKCDPGIRLNTVRQDVMTNKNYNKMLYRYKSFLLYVTATWCDYCCQHEKELLGVKQILLDKTIDGEEVPIVQIHSDTDIEALKDLKVGFFKVPSLYFVREKQFIQYNSFWKADNIIRFINNLINPVVELHSVEDVERFFDTTKNFEEKNDFLGNTVLNIPEETDHHFRNRLIGFFSDIEEYSAEYSQFLSLAEKISHRPDLRIGIVTDKEIVRHFKQIYEGVWFNDHSWNSIVLKRIDKYYFLDLSLLNEYLETFMVYNSISFLDELSNNNNFITQKIITPIAVFFIDTSFIIPNFHSHLKFLINFSIRYVGKYVFMFIDGNTRSQSKEQLGLKKDAP